MSDEREPSALPSSPAEPAPAPPGFRSGFIQLLGRTNAGKSTLLNALVQHHVAAVSPASQTTRHRIMALRHEPMFQMVFVDLPGIHRPLHRMNVRMMDIVQKALHEEPEAAVFVVDASEPFGSGDAYALEMLKGVAAPVILALNKVDRMPKERLLPLMDMYHKAHPFKAIVPISALKGQGLDALLSEIRAVLPEGPRYFPEDYLTDRPEIFLMQEFIREALMQRTREEVPHSTAVEVRSQEERDGLIRIEAVIYVERDSQKGIVIGEGGRLIKAISTQARKALEDFFGQKVFLRVWVEVKSGWRESESMLDELGITDRY